MGPIGPEQLELFAFELGKIAAFHFVYCLAPNLVTMYMSIRSQMSVFIGPVIPDQSVLSALEIEKLNLSSLFGIYPHCYLVLLSTQVSDIGPSWSSCLRSLAHGMTKKPQKIFNICVVFNKQTTWLISI